MSKELHRSIDGHVEHISDGLSLEAHFEGLTVVASSVAGFAGGEDVGEEVHLDLLVAIARASVAASSRDIEGEATWLVATHFALGKPYEEASDVGEDPSVGSGIATGGTSDRGLVDGYDLVDILQSLDLIVGERILERSIKMLTQYR